MKFAKAIYENFRFTQRKLAKGERFGERIQEGKSKIYKEERELR